MADRKITDLTALAAGSQATGDLLTIVDVSEAAATDKNKKITVESLFKGIPGDVGIGTSSPSFSSFGSNTGGIHIQDVGSSSNALKLQSSSNIFHIAASASKNFIFGSTNHPLGISTNGTERLSITADGKIGIGTQSPSYTLHVNGSGATSLGVTTSSGSNEPQIILEDTAASDYFALQKNGRALTFKPQGSEAMRIDSSGRLLVGATSARDNYFSSASLQALQFQIEGTDYRNSAASFTSNSTSAGHGPHLAFGRSRGTAIGSNTLVTNGDTLGAIVFHGNDGSKFVQCARIDTQVDGTPGTDDMPGRLIFQTTADGASSPTERMRIDSSGNLKLRSGNQLMCNDASNHVSVQIGNIDSGSNSGRISADPDSTGSGSYLEFYVDSSEVYRIVNNNVRLSSACNGLQFNGDTAQANALDDYEEGDWTPAMNSGGWTGFTVQTAKYVKIGGQVFVQCYVSALTGSGTTNVLKLSGLPYLPITNGYTVGSVDIGEGSVKGTYCRTESNTNQIAFYYPSEGNTSARVTLKGNQIGDAYIILGLTYFTSS